VPAARRTDQWSLFAFSGDAPGYSSMVDYLDAGFTTWDLADHYGPAEEFIGQFQRELVASRGADALADVQAFTKWVPLPGTVTFG
jgi:hypothetical protein